MSLLALLTAGAGAPVEPEPEPEMWGIGTPSDPIYVPPGTLDRWRAALRASDSTLAKAVVFGDSTIGYGTETVGSGFKSPVAVFLQNLSRLAGFTHGGDGVTGIVSDFTSTPRTMTYPPITELINPGFNSANTSLPMPVNLLYDGSVTVQGIGTRVRVAYHRVGGILGHFTVQIDGGTPVYVGDTAPGPVDPMYRTLDFDGLSDGMHTVKVTNMNGRPYSTTIASIGAGGPGSVPAGTFWYKFVRYDATHDEYTNPSNAFQFTSAGGTSLRITGATNNSGAARWWIYRSDSEAGPYARIADVPPVQWAGYVIIDGSEFADGAALPTGGTLTHGGSDIDVQVGFVFTRPNGVVYHRLGSPGATWPHAGSTKIAENLAMLSPHLSMPSWGINDMNQLGIPIDQVKLDAIQTRAEAFIDQAQAAGSDVLVLLTHFPENYSPVTAAPTREKVKAACIAKGVGWVDLGAGGAMGPYETWDSKGYGYGNHPGYAAHRDQADYLWPVLSAGITPPT